jgi:hypothetical protein
MPASGSSFLMCLSHILTSGCSKLTNECSDYLVNGMPRLSFLNLQGCVGIEPDFIKFISKSRPLVQVCGAMPVEKKLHWTSFKEEKKAPDAGKKKKKKKKKK